MKASIVAAMNLVRENLPFRRAEAQAQKRHRYSAALDERVKRHLADAATENDAKWTLLLEDGDMRVCCRTTDGCVRDPVRVRHRVAGVTAREMCRFFWRSADWEPTVESARTLEVLDARTRIVHQINKCLAWGVAPRDCLYLSSVLEIPPSAAGAGRERARDAWMVCNFSVEHERDARPQGVVRARVDVALVCQTFVANRPADGGEAVTRDNVTCDIVYVSQVDPGGWVPAMAARALCKREYPRFLQQLTDYVREKTKNEELLF